MLRHLIRGVVRPCSIRTPSAVLTSRAAVARGAASSLLGSRLASTASASSPSWLYRRQHSRLLEALSSSTKQLHQQQHQRGYASASDASAAWGDLESHVEEIEDAEKLDTSVTFEQLGLSAKRAALLTAKGLTNPFPIQSRTYADIRSGRDIVGRARTGTGKTLAFALPVVESIDPKRSSESPHCVVVVPTRELAVQVCREFEWIAPELHSTAIYGGVAIGPQGLSLAVARANERDREMDRSRVDARY